MMVEHNLVAGAGSVSVNFAELGGPCVSNFAKGEQRRLCQDIHNKPERKKLGAPQRVCICSSNAYRGRERASRMAPSMKDREGGSSEEEAAGAGQEREDVTGRVNYRTSRVIRCPSLTRTMTCTS